MEGEWSGISSACTLAAVTTQPLNLRILNKKNDEINLEWDPPKELNNSTIIEYIIKVSV